MKFTKRRFYHEPDRNYRLQAWNDLCHNENSAEETNKCAETKDEAKKDENKTVAAGTVKKELCSPFTGVVAPIEEACDEAFAGKMMGDGESTIWELRSSDVTLDLFVLAFVPTLCKRA